MIRVGFLFKLDNGWLGGINYLRNLLSALYSLPEREIEAIVFTGFKSPDKYFDGFPNIRIVRSRLFDANSLPWRLRQSVRNRCSRDLLLEGLLRIDGISVLSHSDWLPGNAELPTIGWIPDFQHVRLPDFFSADEIKARNKYFSDLCQHCSTVIVSSHDAQSDLFQFNPDCAARSVILQFVVATHKDNAVPPTRNDLQIKYKFSGNYFLLPNQFWKHKNHQLVVEALGLLHKEGKRVLVLTTGDTSDYRHPNHFQAVMARASDLHVQDNFFHLGIVPRLDLIGLMRESLAIINPSLFEGWSTTVEEAKSLGKHVLLSDIPIHREQNPPLASYYPPEDANSLAATLWEVWNKPYPYDANIIENAQRTTDLRRLEFAKQYQEIALRMARVKLQGTANCV